MAGPRWRLRQNASKVARFGTVSLISKSGKRGVIAHRARLPVAVISWRTAQRQGLNLKACGVEATYRRSLSSGWVHKYGAISRSLVSLIMCTGGAYRPFLHDRHFSAASSFQIGVSRGRLIASSGRLARVSQR
jgi:hypothetical protein